MGNDRKSKKCNIYVKSFSGVKVRSLNDHAKPSLRQNPNHFLCYTWAEMTLNQTVH